MDQGLREMRKLLKRTGLKCESGTHQQVEIYRDGEKVFTARPGSSPGAMRTQVLPELRKRGRR